MDVLLVRVRGLLVVTDEWTNVVQWGFLEYLATSLTLFSLNVV